MNYSVPRSTFTSLVQIRHEFVRRKICKNLTRVQNLLTQFVLVHIYLSLHEKRYLLILVPCPTTSGLLVGRRWTRREEEVG